MIIPEHLLVKPLPSYRRKVCESAHAQASSKMIAVDLSNMQLRYLGDGTGVVPPKNIFNSGSIITTFSCGATGWHEFDVSSELQLAVDAGYDWAVFTVRSNDWWDHVTIAASEDVAHSPNIVVVPEPTAILLLVLSALAMRYWPMC